MNKDPGKTEIVYGIVTGLIGICVITTVIVLLKCFHGNKRRINNVGSGNGDGDYEMQPYTRSKWHSGKTNAEEYFQNNWTTKREKEAMVLYHPDTALHKTDVDNLILCLRRHDIQVHNGLESPFQNWRDFAEKAGEEVKDIIIVLSSGLIELCEIYKKKSNRADKVVYDEESVSVCDNDMIDKRWNELLGQRHGEYIPCVALDKVRSLIPDKQSDVGIHFVTFCDSQNDSAGECCGEKNDTVSHLESDALLNCLNMHCDISKNQNDKEPTTFNKSPNYTDHWEFIKHYTFLQTKFIYFHTISRKVLEHLLLSETQTSISENAMHTLSLLYVLKNLR